jgi:hypothetical protein
MDKRALAVAFGATVPLMGTIIISAQPAGRLRLLAVPVQIGGLQFPDLVIAFCLVSGFVIMPGVLTVIARRLPFAWGVAPTLIGYVMLGAYSLLFHSLDWSVFSPTIVFFTLVPWIVGSSIGMLIRMIVRLLTPSRTPAPIKPISAPEIAEPGVWPPAPRA